MKHHYTKKSLIEQGLLAQADIEMYEEMVSRSAHNSLPVHKYEKCRVVSETGEGLD